MKKSKSWSLALIAIMVLSVVSCGSNSKTAVTTDQQEAVEVPVFDADSAYSYVDAQVAFGPRVPNTAAHVACGNYLARKLESFGAVVTNQYADLTAFDGTILKARNIIGTYKPETKRRVLLFAHWDSRKWADKDRDPANHHKPILGANDGASGVGILLEIARLIQQQEPAIGIDIIFFDAEDYGAPDFYDGPHKDEYWCLGSQYWSRFPHVPGYNARYGILLDMVGGPNTTFYREYFSEKYARNVNNKVWKMARKLGYERYFIDEQGGGVTDDHLPVNQIARIPSIDIVPNEVDNPHSTFGSTWHTIHDTMEFIDKSTLKAVGQTVLGVIYNEK